MIAPFLAMVFISDKDEYRANKGGTAVAATVLLCLSCILYLGNNVISSIMSLYTVTAAIVTIMIIATSITVKKRIPEQIIGRVITMNQLCATISVPMRQMFFRFCADRLPVTVSYLVFTLELVITLVVMIKT